MTYAPGGAKGLTTTKLRKILWMNVTMGLDEDLLHVTEEGQRDFVFKLMTATRTLFCRHRTYS